MEANAVAGPSNGSAPLTKNAKRRLKKKQQQQQESQQRLASTSSSSSSIARPAASTSAAKQDTRAEYDDNDDASHRAALIDEAADFRIDPNSEAYKAFSNVLSRYQPDTLSAQQQPSKGEIIYSDDDVESEHDGDSDADETGAAAAHLSKRKQKKLQRLTVAELKQLVPKPEVVEWTDVTSTDPRLLVHLKCVRNSVPIPPHWATKRDYLQNKRGIEKPQYQLPAYIADTGIATMKDALKEKEADQSLKQKTRERVQPKMGKMDIDYQKLYDAFFKFQHKPQLSGYGDTYYEGKEYETKYKEKRPGQLSKELIEALSIPPLAPPPWLIAMQRYGPPPSYPHLPIAGLNAPIPQGASWGFHPGGWGRPPVDEYGNPLYGNVLGGVEEQMDADLVDTVEKEHWGQLEPEESDPEEEEDDDGEAEQPAEDEASEQQDVDMSGVQSVSSIGTGLQTPSFTELRKDARIESTPRSLYTVLPERAAAPATAGQFMSSERTYDFSSAHQPDPSAPVLGAETARGTKRPAADSVAMCLNPDELVQHDGVHVDQEQYDVQRRQQSAQRFRYAQEGEDVAEVRAQLQSEREKRQRDDAERRSNRRQA